MGNYSINKKIVYFIYLMVNRINICKEIKIIENYCLYIKKCLI